MWTLHLMKTGKHKRCIFLVVSMLFTIDFSLHYRKYIWNCINTKKMKKGIGNKICLVWERFKTKRALVCSRGRCLFLSPFHSYQDQSPRIRGSITQTLIYRAFGCRRRSARLYGYLFIVIFWRRTTFFICIGDFPYSLCCFCYVHESTKKLKHYAR